MILFQLQCERGDRFEAWFRSNADFDDQAAKHRIDCPLCGSPEVGKALMAPSVPASTRNSGGRGQPAAPAAVPAAAPSLEVSATPVASGPDPGFARAMELMRTMARQLRENSEYVGPRFAEEARKIHYDEAPQRSIYGEASAVDMRELADEGIGFHPLPPLPEDRN